MKGEAGDVKMTSEATMFIGSIEPYTLGEDFALYARRLNHLLTLNKFVLNSAKISVLVSLGGPELYKVLTSLIAPKKETDDDIVYEDLIEKLTAHLRPKKNIIAECFKFFKRSQRHDETLQEYIVELKQMAQDCEFGLFQDKALLIQFVCGIESKKIQGRLLNEPDLKSFEKATLIASSMEITGKQLEIIKHNDFNLNAITTNNKSQNSYNHTSRHNQQQRSRQNSKNRSISASRYHFSQSHQQQRKRNMVCYACGLYGHIKKHCRVNQGEKSKINNLVKMQSKADEGNVTDLGFLNNCTVYKSNAQKIEIKVNNEKILFEIDTGACESVVNKNILEEKFKNCKLIAYDRKMKLISGKALNTYGKIKVEVIVKGKMYNLELTILNTYENFVPLLGRNWLDVLFPTWRCFFSSNSLCTGGVNSLMDVNCEYDDVFKNSGNTVIKDFKAEIVLKENAIPVFCKPSVVPYGLKSKVEDEIKRLCDEGILVPVTRSKWASPLVIVNKGDGTIRLCVNCKRTINKYVESEHIPIPRIDDIFSSMSGWNKFCKLDLMGAYLQVEVGENSRELLTINIHIGLFQYTRLIFGLKTAPQIFNGIICEILKGLDKVHVYFDDILIGGSDLEECRKNLYSVLNRLKEYHVKINKDKCIFFAEELHYLGYHISKDGTRPSREKIEAILNAPEPENKSQLASYLGMVNFYHKFIPNFSGELACLYKLNGKNSKWQWHTEHKMCFEKSKALLTNIETLTHYDPTKPIIISCDASPYGVGGVLAHLIDGVEKPVIFASSTLSEAEKNYSQLHREALAIIFSVKKFHKYIYGLKFTIHSDHQPLRAIFGNKKDLSAVAASRIQRWSIYLSMYDFEIKYKKGTDMKHADGLSRLPLNIPTDIETDSINNVDFSSIPLKLDDIAVETHKDRVLVKIYKRILVQWTGQMTEEERPYYLKRNSLSTEDKCLFYGNRVVIPEKLRDYVLKMLHEEHVGIVRMKALARSYVWWPGIDRDIESFVNSCNVCQMCQKGNKPVLITWKEASYPFERIHVDFCKIGDKTLLVIFDVYSKWIEAIIMKKTLAISVCQELRKVFINFGLPRYIVSDNGPPFSSGPFIRFCESNGIVVLKSPSYHPQSNGSAERAVQTVKHSLKKSLIDFGSRHISWEIRLYNFLLKYRNTPSTVTGECPSNLLFKFKPRTLLDVMISKKDEESVEIKKDNPICVKHDGRKEYSSNKQKIRKFCENENVLYRNVFSNYVKWIPAKIIKKLSNLRYIVLVNGSQKHVHLNQIKKSNDKIVKFRNFVIVNDKSNYLVQEDRKIKRSPYLTRSKVKVVNPRTGDDN